MIDFKYDISNDDKPYTSTVSNKIEINHEYFKRMNRSIDMQNLLKLINDFVISLEHKTHVRILKSIKDDPNPLVAYDLCPIGNYDNQDVYFFDLHFDYGEHILLSNGDLNDRKKTFIASIGINLKNNARHNFESEHNWFYNKNNCDYDVVLSETVERVNTLKYLDVICNFFNCINELDKDQFTQKIIDLRKKFISNNDYVSMDHLMYCFEK